LIIAARLGAGVDCARTSYLRNVLRRNTTMANAREIVEKHVKAALEEAAASSYPRDAVARVLFDEVLKLYKMDRSPEDIASELTAAAENMDADDGIAFMRP
jgi:HEPN domain-containing protein